MTDQVTSPPLNEIVLDTHGPTISVRSAEPLQTVLEVALKAYHETRVHDPGPAPVAPGSGPAGVGFHTELRDTAPVQPSSMPWAPHPYPIQIPGSQQ